MALTTVTKSYGVDDIKIAPITVDNSTTYTVGALVDVPGARQISITPDIESKDLMGDELTLDTVSKVKSFTITVENAKLSLELRKILMGGTVTASGSGTSAKSTYSFVEGDVPGYFQLQAQIKSTDNIGGDLHYLVYKCKVTAAPINGTQDDFATFTFDCKAVYTECLFGGTKKKLSDTIIHATETALAAVSYPA
jgi:hypothetical protein